MAKVIPIHNEWHNCKTPFTHQHLQRAGNKARISRWMSCPLLVTKLLLAVLLVSDFVADLNITLWLSQRRICFLSFKVSVKKNICSFPSNTEEKHSVLQALKYLYKFTAKPKWLLYMKTSFLVSSWSPTELMCRFSVWLFCFCRIILSPAKLEARWEQEEINVCTWYQKMRTRGRQQNHLKILLWYTKSDCTRLVGHLRHKRRAEEPFP